MIDFAMFPPEINSGRMYAGPGAGPMTAASAAWGALADDLYLAAAGYGFTVSDLTSSWLGPSSVSMATAAATYVSWITATAAQAALTAVQATAAAAAYEVAFAMTVPPPVIAANRSLLLALVATNFFGQNTPAIMATEARLRRDVGAGCRGDVRLRRRVIGSSGVDAIHNSAGNHQLLRVCRDGRCGDTSRRYLGRHGRPDGGTTELRGAAGVRINDGVVFDFDVASFVLDDPDVVVRSDVGDEPGLRRCLVRVDVCLGRLNARLGGLADECVWHGDWYVCPGLPDVRIGDEHGRRFGSRGVELTRLRRSSRNRDRGPGGVARSDVSAPGLDLCCAGIQPGCLRVAGRRTARCAAGHARQSDESDGRSAVEFNGAGRRQFSLACPLQLPSRHGATAGIRRLRRWGRLR